MNDGYRGALIVGALTALYYSTRLVLTFVHPRRPERRHITWHVLWMTLGLSVTSAVLAGRVVLASGKNHPLDLWDIARTAQVLLLIAGLRPLWQHTQRAAQARTERERHAAAPRTAPEETP